MEKMKRILSLALCLCMLMSMSMVMVLAEGEEGVIFAEIPEIESAFEEAAATEAVQETPAETAEEEEFFFVIEVEEETSDVIDEAAGIPAATEAAEEIIPETEAIPEEKEIVEMAEEEMSEEAVYNAGNRIHLGCNAFFVQTGGMIASMEFTPTVSDYYMFASTGDADTVGMLYQDGTKLVSDDESGAGSNFCIVRELTAGVTYELRVKYFSASMTGYIPVYVGIPFGTCGDNLTWRIGSSGTLTISGSGAMYDYFYSYEECNIPWYNLRGIIRNVVISSGVTNLGKECFASCSTIESVTIPDSVTSLGDGCFWNCYNLTSIIIPDSVTNIGEYCFQLCNNLTSVKLPCGITSLGDNFFSDCSSLTSITLPDGITSLGTFCFSDCKSLSSIIIPNSVTSLGDYCFQKCENLASVTLSNSVTSLGNCCFSGCHSLTSIIIPNSVTSLGYASFAECKNLKSVTFQGNAPQFLMSYTHIADTFEGVTATVYYDPTTSGWESIVGRSFEGILTWKTTQLATPVITGVANAVNGVTVKWNAVPGAAQYRVFIKNGTGWKTMANTASTSATITGLTSGTKYTFTVRCLSADGKSYTSNFDSTGKTITYVAAPVISSLTNASNGVTVKWDAVPGAVNYRVFYKTASATGWTGFGNTTGTSSTVTGLTSGTKYFFTVRCVSADGKSFTSSYDNTGKSITYTGGQLATPVISSVANAVGGVTVKWGAVSGAVNYRVFYKVGSGSWTKAADTASTSYTVTGLTSGTTYTFTVRCVSADGKTFTSSYDATGKSIAYVAAPVISSLTNASNGVTVKWAAVPGAVNYRVFYKTGTGSWTGFGNTTGTSATVTGLTSGTKYSFTVRCVSTDGKIFTSSYDNTGKSITYTPAATSLATPVISSVANAVNGVTVKWGAVSGAAQYRVFIKSGTGWKTMANTTATSATITGLESGTKYTFTVRCLSADGKSYTSSFDTTGKSITYVAAPALVSVAKSGSNGVLVKWNAVPGATNYRVFYKTGSGSWTKAADTTSTGYTVTGLSVGTKYTFTVRCLSPDGKSFISAYDTTGLSITR